MGNLIFLYESVINSQIILLIVSDLTDLSLGIDRLLIHRGDIDSDRVWIDTEFDQIKIIAYPQLYYFSS